MIRLTLLVAGCSAAVSAQAGFNGFGLYEVVSVESGKVIDLDRDDQTTVIQFPSRGTDNQTWEVSPARGGFFFLRNGMNGYAWIQAADTIVDRPAGREALGASIIAVSG